MKNLYVIQLTNKAGDKVQFEKINGCFLTEGTVYNSMDEAKKDLQEAIIEGFGWGNGVKVRIIEVK